MAVAYEVAGLTKRYPGPKEVLANDRIDLCIATGEIVGIFGPNGAGKTTLVRQLMGLLRPTAGQIRLFDNDLVREPTIATNHVAYFAQETSYFWYLKPRELLAITGRLRGLTSREANSQAYSLLGKFNLGNLAGKTLSRLSFGQARFVALLSVFMGNRPILILDEPTNDLDPLHRRAFWDYLWEVNSREGTTVLLVTHNVHEAEHVVHRVVIVDVQGASSPRVRPASSRRGWKVRFGWRLLWRSPSTITSCRRSQAARGSPRSGTPSCSRRPGRTWRR